MADNKQYVDPEDIITLEFDNGDEEECEMIGVFECAGKEYIALAPLTDPEEAYIFGYKEIAVSDDEVEFEILDIEDEAEFEKAVAEFDAIMAE